MNDNEMSSAEITAELAAEANPVPVALTVKEALTKELADACALQSEQDELSSRESALTQGQARRLEQLREDIRPWEMIMNLEGELACPAELRVELDQVKEESPAVCSAEYKRVDTSRQRLTDADTQEQIDETKDDLLEELKEWLIASHECEIKEVLPLTEDVLVGVLKFASEYEGNHFMGYEVSRF